MSKFEPTYVIVNDRGQYFGWIHAQVDEFDRICSRGVTWVDDWECARVFHTKRGATRTLRRVEFYDLLRKAAVVGD